jgi:N-acetylglutamate synthase-like GNAT family acetyltransferase
LLSKQVSFGSDEHRQAIQLRNEFLRKPIGFTYLKNFPAEEKDWQHFVIMNDDGTVIGCVVAIKRDKATVRLRQMAIHEKFQRQGVGRALLSFTEKACQRAGIEKIIVHARKDAAGFYAKTGYQQEGEEFMEVSIPHFAMIKLISA